MAKPPEPEIRALVEVAEVELTAQPKVAGGVGAITATTGFLWRETGLIRGARTLLKINQPDGFDCPGLSLIHI